MGIGYIYVLQNRSFGPYTVKIGKTGREPDVRAKEIYGGSTGVPQPFDIGYACQVGDCDAAEKLVHQRLNTYRVNPRREFFEIPPDVARAVAEECCLKVNLSLGHVAPRPMTIERTPSHTVPTGTLRTSSSWGVHKDTFEVPLKDILPSPIGTSVINQSQRERIEILSMIFAHVFPDKSTIWIDSFSRDKNPETEIEIWEHLAKAFMIVDQIEYLGDAEKREAFCILLLRSNSPEHKVLKKFELKRLQKAEAIKILANYTLPPKPVVVRREA